MLEGMKYGQILHRDDCNLAHTEMNNNIAS